MDVFVTMRYCCGKLSSKVFVMRDCCDREKETVRDCMHSYGRGCHHALLMWQTFPHMYVSCVIAATARRQLSKVVARTAMDGFVTMRYCCGKLFLKGICHA